MKNKYVRMFMRLVLGMSDPDLVRESREVEERVRHEREQTSITARQFTDEIRMETVPPEDVDAAG